MLKALGILNISAGFPTIAGSGLTNNSGIS